MVVFLKQADLYNQIKIMWMYMQVFKFCFTQSSYWCYMLAFK